MALENVDAKERRIMDIEAIMAKTSLLETTYAGKVYSFSKGKDGSYHLYKGTFKEVFRSTEEEAPTVGIQMPSITVTLDEVLNIVSVESLHPGRTLGQQTVYDIIDRMIAEEAVKDMEG
jgi:hypothetical protein